MFDQKGAIKKRDNTRSGRINIKQFRQCLPKNRNKKITYSTTDKSPNSDDPKRGKAPTKLLTSANHTSSSSVHETEIRANQLRFFTSPASPFPTVEQ